MKMNKTIRLDVELSDAIKKLVEVIDPPTSEIALIEIGIKMAVEKYGPQYGITLRKK